MFSTIPDNLPTDMFNLINQLKKSKSKRDCLKKTYSALTSKYRGYAFKTYFRFFDIFTSDTNKLWAKSGFLHCSKLNFLMRILLVKSGHFQNEDIKTKWTLVWYLSPHQYLQIRLNDNEYINIDMWGKAYGIPFGDYAHGFH